MSKLPLKCQCGEKMTREDADFWGECGKCRGVLPIRSNQSGDTKGSGGHTDREYHGSQSNAEW